MNVDRVTTSRLIQTLVRKRRASLSSTAELYRTRNRNQYTADFEPCLKMFASDEVMTAVLGVQPKQAQPQPSADN